MASCPGSSFIFLSVRRATPPPSPLRKGTRYLAEAHRGRPSGPLAAFGHIVLVAFLPGDGLDVSDSAPLRSALFPLLSMLLHSHQVFLRPVCLDCPFPHTPRHSLMLGVEAVASLVGAAELSPCSLLQHHALKRRVPASALPGARGLIPYGVTVAEPDLICSHLMATLTSYPFTEPSSVSFVLIFCSCL